MRSQPTPASAKAFSALRRRRAPLRDAGFTISSTRSIRLGANLIAVAALMACQGLCEPAFPDSPATQEAARTLRLRSHIVCVGAGRDVAKCSGRGSNPHGILSQGILSPTHAPLA